MFNKQDLSIVWFLDNQRQMECFLVSIRAVWKYNGNNVSYIVYVPDKLLKKKIIEMSALKEIPLKIENNELFLKVFQDNSVNNNMMILSVIAPFLSKSKYTIFLDNDIISNVKFHDLINMAEERLNFKDVTLIRRHWELTEINLGYKFANKYYDVLLNEYKKANGNGGVVIYNTEKYREIFDNKIENILEKISLFIKKIIEFNFEGKYMNADENIFLDDEWFLNIYTCHDSPSTLPKRYNYSLNLGIEELIKIFEKEKTATIHIADNPKGIKNSIYKVITGKENRIDNYFGFEKKYLNKLIKIISDIID